MDVFQDAERTFSEVEKEIGKIVETGCVPVVMGGNAGPTTYPVLKAITERTDGPTAVLNLDAHGDNQPGRRQEDDPREPRWAATWALRILELPTIDPTRYYHFGLRGPINDRAAISRFVDWGVRPENIATYWEIRQARQADYDEWAEGLTRRIADTAAKVWIALDPDVLDAGSVPDFSSEPLGPTVDEVTKLVYRIGRAAGRDRFGGLSIMATPHDARALHQVLLYVMLYALAGMVSTET